jgi:hypothetical protein
MKDEIGCVFFILLLWGAGWAIVNFWPVLLILAAFGVMIAIAAAYEAKPNPQREIRKAEQEAKREINKAGKTYRKYVKDLTK